MTCNSSDFILWFIKQPRLRCAGLRSVSRRCGPSIFPGTGGPNPRRFASAFSRSSIFKNGRVPDRTRAATHPDRHATPPGPGRCFFAKNRGVELFQDGAVEALANRTRRCNNSRSTGSIGQSPARRECFSGMGYVAGQRKIGHSQFDAVFPQREGKASCSCLCFVSRCR
jgi:hypothetical protein